MPRWIVRSGLLVAALAACLLGAELHLRARAEAFRHGLEEANGWDPTQACNRPDPELVYRGIESWCGANSQGFVDVEHAIDKPAGVFRIVVIGDSIALGHPQAYGSSFAQVLERLLSESCPGRAIEVVVLATVGYSSQQELALLRREAMRYAPDLVLWSYCLNDPAHPFRHDASAQLGRYYHRPGSYLVDYLEERLFLTRENLRALVRGCPGEFHAFLHCAYAGEVEDLFVALGEWQTETGVPVIVIVHPVIERDGSPKRYSLEEVHRRLIALAAANHLAAIDLLDAYRGRSFEEIGLGFDANWYDIYHPNRFGHELAARHLRDELLIGVRALSGCASPATPPVPP
jgi:hypothetical protein